MFCVSQREDVTVIDVTEDVDIVSGSLLENAIALAEQQTSSHLIVNMEACKYCDSTGLAVLIRARKRLRERLLVVMTPGSICHRIFAITGLTDVFQASPDIQSALSRARAIAP
jgi:anti-anti-sigma factor